MNTSQIDVTIYPKVYGKHEPTYIKLDTALNRIKSGAKNLPLLEALRNGDKSQKKELPIVCFSGTFTERTDEGMVDHSSIIVVDFDHVDVDHVKALLCMDDYVFACWVSPSGDGLKALIKISHPERHRDHFRAIIAYFDKSYGLEVDGSGINESRACFESYDPDMCLKDSCDTFTAFQSEEKLEKQEVRIAGGDHTDYMKLNLAARMVRNSVAGERHVQLLRASVLCGGYIAVGRMEEEEVVRVLIREFSRQEYDPHYQLEQTIRDGITEGKSTPIRDLMDAEEKINRELDVSRMDMSFISSDDEDMSWISDYAEGKIKVGLTTGDDRMDEHFRYKKDFTIINGHSNIGKTTFALYMLVNSALRHDWKWLIYSSENKTASIKMRLMEMASDIPVKQMTYMKRKEAFKWVNKHFTIVSNKDVYSYLDLIKFCEKVTSEQHIDGFFIDPYNSLKIEMTNNRNVGTHEYHYEATSEFLTYSKRKDIAIWLNTHAVTEAQRMKGDDGLPIAPFAEQTEGGGKFVNRCDNFLTFHRKIQHDDPQMRRTMEFHVRKVRETETGGSPTSFQDPLMYQMNSTATGFTNNRGKLMFTPFGEAAPKQEEIFLSLSPDSAF
tara:strand:+ start:95 stop:1924 length:1830 start_codon:yes stop_codon:yes gene_type:complete